MKAGAQHSRVAGWITWLLLSLFSLILLLSGKSYPAQVSRETVFRLFRYPLVLVNWIPQGLRLRQENELLRQRTIELFAENCQLRELAREGQRLEALLGISRMPGMAYFPTRVLTRGNPQQPQSVVIDLGLADGVRGGEALITVEGLAGSLLDPHLHHSRALLVTHRDFRARAQLARTREEGIIAGNGTLQMELRDIPLSSGVAPGDTVMTSGHGSRFVGGIPLGTVLSVHETGGMFKVIRVRALARLSRLEELYVVQQTASSECLLEDFEGAATEREAEE